MFGMLATIVSVTTATVTDVPRYRSDFARHHCGQGQIDAMANDVLLVLDARGIEVPEDMRERITSCTELDQLETWIRRAATLGTARDLFSEDPE
jgi:hypothetical protein